MDPFIQIYTTFWFFASAYFCVRMLKHIEKEALIREGKDEDGDLPMEEQLVTAMEQVLDILSPNAVLGMVIALHLVFIAMDTLGLFLTYQYVMMTDLHRILFALIALSVAFDALSHLRYTARSLNKVMHSDKEKDVLVRYLQIRTIPFRWVNRVATFGKLLAALYLFLTAYF